MNTNFAALADEFENRVRAAEIGPATEVTLVTYTVDRNGDPVTPIRSSLAATTTVKMNDQSMAMAFAGAMHADTILQNINSLVRHAPTEFVRIADAPTQDMLRIVNFDIEITQP